MFAQKLRRSLPYVATLIVPAMTALAVLGRGWFLLVPPLFLFVLTPAADFILGEDKRDLPADPDAWRDASYDVWIWLWIPLQLSVMAAALWFGAHSSSWPELAGLVFASGLLGAIGINMAHEFMHRKGAVERGAAELLLYTSMYPHFAVEHVLGHHKNVATEHDPGTARRGDNAWLFVPRSMLLSLVSAWRLERARVQKLGVSFGLGDRRVRYPLVQLALVAAAALVFGPMGAAFFVAQALVAIVLLELINYIEHYGLERAVVVGGGGFERVRPAHSWSSAHRLTSWYLLNLPRHADHHANASRPWYALRHVEEGPQMPAGYATMIVLAAVPPLWRAVMHPRLDRLAQASG